MRGCESFIGSFCALSLLGRALALVALCTSALMVVVKDPPRLVDTAEVVRDVEVEEEVVVVEEDEEEEEEDGALIPGW